VLGVIALMGLSSCKPKKDISNTTTYQPLPSKTLVDRLEENQVEFDWLRAKANATLKYKGETNAIKANIRIRQDSATWVHLSKAGVPVFTTLISQDSVKFLIRVGEKSFFEGTYEYIQRLLNIEMNYTIIEEFLSGNPIAFDPKAKFDASTDSTGYLLTTDKVKPLEKLLKKRKRKDREYQYTCWIDPVQFQCSGVRVDFKADTTAIEVHYGKWEMVDEINMPREASIQITTPSDTLKLELEYYRLKMNEKQSFPFKVTDSYEPFDIEGPE